MTVLDFFDAGFKAIVSIVPPNGKISPESKIVDPGKAPGMLRNDGSYAGYAWLKFQPERFHIESWMKDGNNFGLLSAEFPGFDVDVTDAALAGEIRALIEDMLGPTMVRHGRAPKVLLMFRAAEKMKSFRHKYTFGEETQLVEFLASGHQYVINGVHPDTGKEYWVEDPVQALGLLGADALRVITAEEVDSVFDAIDALMLEKGYKIGSKNQTGAVAQEVDQESLRAPDMDELAELVAEIPNVLSTREEYVQFGHAIKAAGQADPGRAFDIWAEWCSRWEDGSNDHDIVAKDWKNFAEPYRVGFDYLLGQARYYGVNTGSYEFGMAADAPEGFTAPSSAPAPAATTDPDVQASQQALAATGSMPGNFTESQLAQEFISRHGEDYRVLKEVKDSYLRWDGVTWVECTTMGYFVQQFLDDIATEVRNTIEKASVRDPIIMRLGKRSTQTAVLGNIKEHPAMQVSVNDLDTHPDLLNTPKGPLDLTTGQMLPPDRSLLLTRCTPVAPNFDRKCPAWERFIEQVMLGDQQTVDWLQTLAGYWLTGRTTTQIFPFFQGVGANGKSVFIGTIQHVMGEGGNGYAATAARDLFQTNRNGNKNMDPRPELARLHGARLVVTNETVTNSRWDEQLIKQVTGGDAVSARALYGTAFSYIPSYKVVVTGNEFPNITAVGRAMIRRMQVLSWKFDALSMEGGPDDNLSKKLRDEAPAIMAWLAEGARRWYEDQLPECPQVKSATEDYLEDQDPLGEWIKNHITFDKGLSELVTTNELYSSFTAWQSMNQYQPWSKIGFSRAIKTRFDEMQVRYTRQGSQRGYVGLEVDNVADFLPDNVTQLPPRKGRS